MERISMSVKELERFRVLNLVLQKNISKKRASEQLGVTDRHLKVERAVFKISTKSPNFACQIINLKKLNPWRRGVRNVGKIQFNLDF